MALSPIAGPSAHVDVSLEAECYQLRFHRGAWVSHLALVETAWVLDAVYERTASEIATAVELLLNHRELTLQDPDVVAAALDKFRSRPAVGFSDCLMLEVARRAGHLPLGTFDRNLGKFDRAHKL